MSQIVGKCRAYKSKIFIQYPQIETANRILYVLIFVINGINVDSVLYCLLTSALLILAIIDFQTFEIPIEINYFIFVLGIIRTAVHYRDWCNHVIGFFAVSVVLYLIIIITKGRGIGGGDMKMMAVCGLFLGWKEVILAFFLGCVIGSVIHIIRMWMTECDHVLALGPYLSAGVWIAMLWGTQLITWYFR